MTNNSIDLWMNTPQAEHYLRALSPHMERAIKTTISPSTLVVGELYRASAFDAFELPLLCKSVGLSCDRAWASSNGDVVADPAFLPFDDGTFSTIFLSHSLESTDKPHQALREAYRALAAEGHLVVIGFNPFSFCGIQRLFRLSSVPHVHFYRLGRVLDWLSLLNFDVIGSSMFQYAPLTKVAKLHSYLNAIENIGDRWFPLLGGAYCLVAKKREVTPRFIGASSPKRKSLRPTPATVKTAL